MISRIWKEMQNKKRDNKGAALVMVIIAIAFIGMLVGMILYMAYCNYLMKANDTKAKDNFYTAEYALDVINAGLQQDVSEAMAEAYVHTMKNSAASDAVAMEIDFQDKFIVEMKTKLQDRSSGIIKSDKWYIDYLKSFWVDSGMTPATMPGDQGPYLGAKTEGANVYNDLTVSEAKDYLTLKNLEVVYTDSKGFVSIIKTDIRIKVPSIGFAQSVSKLSIENFSLIANKSLVNDDSCTELAPGGVQTADGADVKISGNVFGGYDGVQINNQVTEFVIDPADQTSNPSVEYNLIADSLNVKNALDGTEGLVVSDSFSTYVDNINLESGRLNLNGTSYVGNDLSIGGKGSEVSLSGKYYGYGGYINNSAASSSILINGGNTSLDFSGLKELLLSGHAYVGATRYDANIDRMAYTVSANTAEKIAAITSDKITDNIEEEEYEKALEKRGGDGKLLYDENEESKLKGYVPRNEADVMTGESISVKANQLLYMVPAECVGFNAKTNEQVIGKNPMTYEEYKFLTDTKVEKKDASGAIVVDPATNETVMENVYEPVRLNVLWNKLGGISYTNNYKAVYRRVNGTVLVYLYLDFDGNETMANAFYKAYYDYDPEGINEYVDSYIASMRWSTDLTNKANLTLAGNAFYLNRNGEVVFLEDDFSNATKYDNMVDRQTEYSKIHQSLMHSLSKDYNLLTDGQRQNDIFDTLVDDSKFATMAGADYKNAAGDIKARITTGDILYPSTACPLDTKLIVARGDIYLDEDFTGLAIAGGNIYLCKGCDNIRYNPSAVLQALRTEAVSTTGNTMYAYEIFGASGSITYGTTSSSEEEQISLEDLILYQNWKKE